MTNQNDKSKFIVFEGIDGSGKSTQVDLVYKKILELGIPVFLTHEPNYEGPIGQLIKKFLDEKSITEETEYGFQLLYCADRGFHVAEIKEKLKNEWVVCDRYFYSTLAHIMSSQNGEKYLNTLKNVSENFLQPDLTIFIDYPADKCIEQINKSRNGHADYFENLERQTKIRKAYLSIAQEYNMQIVERQEKTAEELSNEIIEIIKQKFLS